MFSRKDWMKKVPSSLNSMSKWINIFFSVTKKEKIFLAVNDYILHALATFPRRFRPKGHILQEYKSVYKKFIEWKHKRIYFECKKNSLQNLIFIFLMFNAKRFNNTIRQKASSSTTQTTPSYFRSGAQSTVRCYWHSAHFIGKFH